MRKLLSKEYFPFGSQYYRAPSPHKEDWEGDLRKMSELGFNTVKFWVQWRWNNPAEGEFYFDDIDELMDLAQRFNLRVMLNTIFDVAPAWIYKKYPGASMVTLSGQIVGPQTQPHRQIGGLGYCFNNDEVTTHLFDFLAVTVKRYKDHPSLETWNVGSEPELTSSMAELRLYADNADNIGDMLCYCSYCENKFKLWLREKYGSLDDLNLSWDRNYQSFDEVELPKTRNTFNDMIDWRMFFVHTIGENVKRRFEVAKEIDNGRHPLMCHHVFIQGFPVTSTANDPWNVGRFGDLHGFTQMDDAAMIDILRSCAKDKPVISAEMLMLPGYTLDLPQKINANDVKRFIFSGIAGNLKGFIFWQFRPEILGRETPAWGLTYLDGSSTPWLEAYAETGNVLQKNASFLLDSKPHKAETAILYNPENQVFAWEATGNEKNATDSLLGIHRALYEHNFIVDFIHPREFPHILNNYKVLILPFPYLLNEQISSDIEKWVKDGGVLISESYTAGWNREKGHHEKIVPGYGLHKVFGARQLIAEPDKEGKVEIITTREIPFIKKGTKVYGSIVKETFLPEGAKVLAKFASGEPAVTYNEYGKGRAVQIGSYPGLVFHRGKVTSNGELIAGLVEYCIDIKRPQSKKVRVDILENDKQQMLIIQNLQKKRTAASVIIPGMKAKVYTEQFSGRKIRFRKEKGKSVQKIQMSPLEVQVYIGDI